MRIRIRPVAQNLRGRVRGCLAQAALLGSKPGWSALPAVKDGRVYAVDANAYFARPGPRLVEGMESLAHLIHPGRFAWNGAPDAYAAVTQIISAVASWSRRSPLGGARAGASPCPSLAVPARSMLPSTVRSGVAHKSRW
jgi:hypothetical protein